MKTLQYQLGNGAWTDCEDRTEEFINKSESFIANNSNATHYLGNYNSVQDKLDAGKRVATGTDWYEEIRYKPEPTVIQTAEMKKCDCGCTIPRSSVMNASVGTSCPDCYDRMSY